MKEYDSRSNVSHIVWTRHHFHQAAVVAVPFQHLVYSYLSNPSLKIIAKNILHSFLFPRSDWILKVSWQTFLNLKGRVQKTYLIKSESSIQVVYRIRQQNKLEYQSPNDFACDSRYASCWDNNQTVFNVCSGRGTCVLPDTCRCNDGYTSYFCEFNTCSGENQTLSNVCSGYGICQAPKWAPLTIVILVVIVNLAFSMIRNRRQVMFVYEMDYAFVACGD